MEQPSPHCAGKIRFLFRENTSSGAVITGAAQLLASIDTWKGHKGRDVIAKCLFCDLPVFCFCFSVQLGPHVAESKQTGPCCRLLPTSKSLARALELEMRNSRMLALLAMFLTGVYYSMLLGVYSRASHKKASLLEEACKVCQNSPKGASGHKSYREISSVNAISISLPGKVSFKFPCSVVHGSSLEGSSTTSFISDTPIKH